MEQAGLHGHNAGNLHADACSAGVARVRSRSSATSKRTDSACDDCIDL